LVRDQIFECIKLFAKTGEVRERRNAGTQARRVLSAPALGNWRAQDPASLRSCVPAFPHFAGFCKKRDTLKKLIADQRGDPVAHREIGKCITLRGFVLVQKSMKCDTFANFAMSRRVPPLWSATKFSNVSRFLQKPAKCGNAGTQERRLAGA